jgi:hypothetical protein
MQVVGYENMAGTKYEHCIKCNSKAMYFTGDKDCEASNEGS